MTAIEMTTNPGLEGLAHDEFRDALAAAGLPAPDRLRSGMRGRVLSAVDAPWDALLPVALTLRAIHHVIRPLHRFPLPAEDPVTGIAEAVGALDLPELRAGQSFRITANRSGRHEFSSQDVAPAAGAAVVRATGAPVDLHTPGLNLRIDIIGDMVAVGVQVTARALSLRHHLDYRQKVALKPNVAYAMLRLAGLRNAPATVLDPFCGSGTLLLEAADLFPEARLIGGDFKEKAFAGAARNLEAAGHGHRAQVFQIDAREMSQALAAHIDGGLERGIDLIITNPPFGRQLGRKMHFFSFYRRWLGEARKLLAPGGRMAVLVYKRDAFRAAAEKAGFRINHVKVVETSGLFVAIFVIAPYADTPPNTP